jgi:hypothetical protein
MPATLSKEATNHFYEKFKTVQKKFTSHISDYNYFIEHNSRLKTVYSNIFYTAG